MEARDIEAVSALEAVCFDDPWQKESIAFELAENPFSRPFVLEEEGTIAGYAFLWVIFERAELANIAIAPADRSRHLGSALLEHLIAQAKEAGCETMMLDVRPSNAAARALYARHGFLEVNRTAGYYANGEDAIVMVRAL